MTSKHRAGDLSPPGRRAGHDGASPLSPICTHCPVHGEPGRRSGGGHDARNACVTCRRSLVAALGRLR